MDGGDISSLSGTLYATMERGVLSAEAAGVTSLPFRGRLLQIWQVDVFSERPLSGNPAAIVFGGSALDRDQMLAIARETNLSETVFIMPPKKGGHYAVRIFTTRREVPFAVHPAIAAAHAFAEASGFKGSTLRQEGTLSTADLHRAGSRGAWFADVTRARFWETDLTTREVADFLGVQVADIAPRRLEVAIAGVPWAMIELTHPSLLASLQLDHRRIADATRRNRAVGITVFARTPGSAAIARMRSFAPAEGIYEDPVCGSCAGSLASLLRRDDPALAALPEFLFEQGLEIGRTGCVRVIARDGGTLAVGGAAVTVMRGQLAIEE